MTNYRGEAEYAALREAIKHNPPPCTNDDRYIRDALSARDEAILRGICRECPVADICGAYAAKAKPEGGFWAGRNFAAKGTS